MNVKCPRSTASSSSSSSPKHFASTAIVEFYHLYFIISPPLIFESHRIYRRRNFIINHFSLVQASNTEFSQPGNRDENRFNFWKNANTRISPFIFILFLAFLLRNRISKPPPFFFVITRVRMKIRFVSAKRKINPMGLMESVEARSRWITAIQSVPGVVRSRLNKMNRTGF